MWECPRTGLIVTALWAAGCGAAAATPSRPASPSRGALVAEASRPPDERPTREALAEELKRVQRSLQRLIEEGRSDDPEGRRACLRELTRRERDLREALEGHLSAERGAVLALRRLHAQGWVREEHDRVRIILPNALLFGPDERLYGLGLELRNVSSALTLVPDARVVVEAHGEGRGSHEHNDAITRRRAREVERFLTEHGVDAARITAVGRGLDAPLREERSAAARAQNGRVEVVVLGAGGERMTRWLDEGLAPVEPRRGGARRRLRAPAEGAG